MRVKFQILFFLFISNLSFAQNIPVGSIDFLEQRSRNEQLLGQADSLISFATRPLSIDLFIKNASESNKTILKALPITLIQQYNTFAPYGWNDGSLIPSKGYQTLISAGVYAKKGMFSIQLRPEYVYAANPGFEIFPLTEIDPVRRINAYYLNIIDTPAPFGDSPYSKLNWGQSNINLTYKKMMIGLSSENLWWGPGTRSSLLMSNTATGFLYFTLNTKQPLKTAIGSFEGQIICGKLEGSGFTNPKSQFIIDGIDYEEPKNPNWRYINGLSINYQPKWVSGLFLGLNRAIQVYREDMGNSFSDFMPIFSPFQKANTTNEDAKNRDQVASLFFRWVMKESQFEFYGENGWNDHSQNINDLFQSPEHSSAYLFGFNKIFMLNKIKNKYLKVNFETTHLEQTADRSIRNSGAWYQHWHILQGYTNNGEVLGAGIGPGSNLYTLDFSVWEKDKVWGIQVERYAHNLDFYYDVYTDYNHKWIDISLNTYAYRNLGRLGIQAKLGFSEMLNYQYQYKNNKINMQFQLSLQYHL